MSKEMIFYVALYIRLSREDGDKEESDSVGNQRKLLLDYIAGKEDLVLKDLYIDDGYSGTNFDRPAFKRMMKDIEKRAVNCVIVKDLSRFGRDYIDTGRYLERYFPEQGVRFIALSDGVDSIKQSYDILLPIKNIFNEQYARDISKKIQATIKTKQHAGEFIGAFASYGYKKSPADKNKLIIDEYAADVVRRIFDMYIAGNGKQQIARILSQEGIMCPTEYKNMNGDVYRNSHYRSCTKWSYSTVNSILHKEIYTGNMVQGMKHQSMRSPQKKMDKEDWIVVENTHEPIIDMDTWEKAQRLLNQRTRKLDFTTNQNIFAGFVRCGDCDAAMAKVSWSRADGSKSHSLYCGTYKRFGNRYCTPHGVPISVLEQIVLQDLNRIIQDIDDLEALVQKETAEHPKQKETTVSYQLTKFSGELDKVKRWKQSIYQDYKEDLITKEEYIAYRQDYIRKETQLKQQIEKLQESNLREKEEDFVNTPWISRLLRLRGIDSLNRDIIVEMIDRIYIYEDRKIRIVYNFSNELELLFEKEVIMRK